MIIDHLDQIDDFTGEIGVVSRMKQNGTDVISPMQYEHLKCESLALKAITGFNINTVSYEMFGPVFDNDFGVLFIYRVLDSLNLVYDEYIWFNLNDR